MSLKWSEVAQSCLTLCDPMDCSHGIFQARLLEWVVHVFATAKSLQSCPTLCNPIDGSPPGSPVPGIFSRQEHWSGLPFPSPMQKSEKWKWSHSVMSDPQRPYGLQPSRLLCPWDFPGKSTGVGCHCLLWYMSLPCLKILPTGRKDEAEHMAHASYCTRL